MRIRRVPIEVKALIVAVFFGGLLLLLALISDWTLGRLQADYRKITDRDVRSLVLMRSIVRNSAEWRQQVMFMMLSEDAQSGAKLEDAEANAGLNDGNFALLREEWRGTVLMEDMDRLGIARQRYREAVNGWINEVKTGGPFKLPVAEYAKVEALYQDYLQLQDNVTLLIEEDMRMKLDHVSWRLKVVRWVVRVLGSWPVLAVVGTLAWAAAGVAWALAGERRPKVPAAGGSNGTS